MKSRISCNCCRTSILIMEANDMEKNGLLEWYGADYSWGRARRKEILQKSICAVKRCSPDLLVFEQVSKTWRLSQKAYRGIQEIRLDDIRGSVGRSQDFSMTFLPRWRHMRQRWEAVNTVMLMQRHIPIWSSKRINPRRDSV